MGKQISRLPVTCKCLDLWRKGLRCGGLEWEERVVDSGRGGVKPGDGGGSSPSRLSSIPGKSRSIPRWMGWLQVLEPNKR